MSSESQSPCCTQFLRNNVALRMIRILILILMLASIPMLFVYHSQMSSIYGSTADANQPPPSPTTPSSPSVPSTNSTNSSIPQTSTSSSLTWTPTTLWSTMQPVDYCYIVLSILTLFLHVHPTRPFFKSSQVANLCVLILLAYIWIMLSVVWFTDLTWKSYDPHLYTSSSVLDQQNTTTTTAITPTATSIQGIISGVADGYTLFPSQEPTIMTSFSTPKPTATATVTSPATATATSISAASAAAAIQDIQWASQCHTSSGLDTSPCELMMAYQILGCLIGAALILEGTISWYINMQEESVEQRLKRLQAKDDAKALKLAKRTKRVQRELQALDNYKRPVIQGPMIG